MMGAPTISLSSGTVTCTPIACFSIIALPKSIPMNLNLSNGSAECSSICDVMASVSLRVEWCRVQSENTGDGCASPGTE